MTDVRHFPVGHKKPARHDPRTLSLSSILDHTALPPLPTKMLYGDRVHPWGMYANDKIGDCTLAGAAHLIELWTKLAGKEAVPTTKAITTLYKHLSPNDDGLVLLDVLNLWRHTGIAGHQIHAFAKVDRSNLDYHIKLCIALFGGVYAGLELPLSAQDQVGKVWDVPAGGLHGDGKRNSWGGHCIAYVGYDEDGYEAATWGTIQRASKAFVQTYGDEEYGVLTQDWAKAPTSSGISFTALQSELTQIAHAS